MFIGNKKCRIYAACGVSQTPNKSEFYEVLRYINQCLIKWVRRSYKKKNTRSRAEHWLGAVARRDRNLFAHWKFGILPSVGEGAV